MQRALLLRFPNESEASRWFHKIELETDSASVPVPERDLQGWLNKRGENRGNWKKRWFMLVGNLLLYFKEEGRNEPWPINALPLASCDVELVGEGKFKKSFCFAVTTKGDLTQSRHLYLQASSEPERVRWMHALRLAIASRTAPTKETGTVDIVSPVMRVQGWLTIRP